MYEVAIIGAGPAGASAAIITSKANKKIIVIDNNKSITARALIKNYYGVNEINGIDLVKRGKEQARKFGAEMIDATVLNIGHTESGFKIVSDRQEFEAKNVIIATGLMLDLAEKVGLKTKPGTEPRIQTVLDVTPEGKTNIDGIWAAGTVAGMSVHTIIIAGDGAKVAINLISEMNGERYVDHDR